MQCPHCAADVAEGLRFCPACRKRVVAPTAGFDQAPPRPAVPRAPTGDPAAAAARPVPPLESAPPPPRFDAPARGYVLRFHPGPAAVAEGQADAAPFHLKGYAITAVPASVQAGIRRFCADDSGLISVMPEGAVPTDDGRCPESSQPLR